jgi:hypothetical protein
MANFLGIIILKGLLTFMNRTSTWRGVDETFIYRNSFITVGLSNWEFYILITLKPEYKLTQGPN